jgi:hypothetical protein
MVFSNLEKAMALVIGIDIATPGFSRSAAKAAVGVIGRVAGPLATRAATALPAAAAYSPVGTGVALGGLALATPQGQQLLDDVSDIGRRDRIALNNALAELTQVAIPKAKKRTKSRFNKMVSSGMKTVKASSSYGKRGTISNSKRAFSVVTKAASAVSKGKKALGKGIKGRLMRVMRKIK